MGRGLSKLQKTILTMQPDQTGHILVRDVITNHYGWEQHAPYHHFSKKEIGAKKYISAYIAIRKSLKRLGDRGLIWSPDPLARANNHSHYTLTPAGREVLAKLSQPAKKDDVVELRYLRDIGNPQDGGVWHPKGEIIQVDKENAKRMLVTGIWEVVTPIG